jgi:hypothetical protein
MADVDQSVLVNADVDKRSEVGDDARKFHTGLQIGKRIYSLCKAERFKLPPRISSGFLEFCEDILKRGKSGLFADIFFQIELALQLGAAVEGIGSIVDAKEPCREVFTCLGDRVLFKVQGVTRKEGIKSTL